MSDVTIGNGNGTYNVNGSQGGTISVGNGNDTVVVTGGSGQTITIGNGNDSLTVNGATGDTIRAGNGNDRVTVSGGSGNTIVAGNGNVTVVASADHNDTITVGNGNITVYLGANDTLTVGKGNDLVVLPSSTPTLTTPASITVLEDHTIGLGIGAALSATGFGQEKIYGFATNDKLEVSTSQFANFAAVVADARQVGQNTVITVDPSDTITLENFQLSSLRSNNVVFTNGASSTTVSLTISGLPSDATLSSAADPGGVSYNATTHVWTVASGALADLALHAGEVTGATLLVTATDSATGYSISRSIALTVNPVAPTLTAPASLTVTAGQTVALGIGETPYDPRDVVSLRIAGVPSDATLSAGTRSSDGSWTLTPAQLSGLTLTAGSATVTSLTVTATNTLGITASTSDTISLTITSASTISVAVNGTAQEGQVLTASVSGSTGRSLTYQWQSSADGTHWSNIANATGATYQVQEGDENDHIRVQVTPSGGSAATSAATAAVLDAAPTVTTPVITGTAQEGQTLTTSASSGQGDNPVTYAWYSSADGYTHAIDTGATHLVTKADEGSTIEVKATATNDNGVGVTATSAATAAVLDAPPTVTTPTISGTGQAGQTLTASADGGDNSVSYTWYSSADGYTSPIGTGTSYQLKEGDEGFGIEVTATSTNADGVSVSATSGATGPVLDAAPTITTPAISGTAQEGQTLTASAAAGESDNAVSYAWYSSADGYTNPIGMGATYQVKEGDEGSTIQVKATATNDNGVSVTATSAATTPVLDAAPTVTTPVITGTAQEGQTLSVSTSAGQSDNAVTYAWYSSVDNFTNAIGTGSIYLVKEGDEGFTIEAKATVTNDNGVSISATSAPTSAVLDAAPTVTSPVVTGTAQEGQTLSVSASAGQSDNAVSYAWYSSADNYTNPIATGSTYQVKEGDEGFTIEAKATVTNDNGMTVSATSAPTSAVLDAAPTVTTPIVTGTAQEGQTLSVTASAGQSDNPVTYAWYSSADNFTNSIGTGSTYTVQEGDEGFRIEAKATATNDNGVHVTATSAATSTVIDNASVSVAVTVLGSGAVQQGGILVASATVTGDPDDLSAPISYQWQSSVDGGLTWTNVAATTTGNVNNVLSSLYQLGEGDEGKIFRAVASITDDTGQVVSTASAATTAVADVPPVLTVPFSYALDELKIVKNASVAFDDTFTNGPPPVGGTFAGTPVAFSTNSGVNGSTLSEVSGKAILASAGAIPGGQGGLVQALLVTNTQPQGTGTGQSNGGLKQNATFTVGATYDLTTPVPFGGGYGVMLTNTAPGVGQSEAIELMVQRSTAGGDNIVLLQFNPSTNTFQQIANQLLTAQEMTNTQIELDLAHNTANTSTITASFKLFTNGTQTEATTTFATTGHAFNSQTFTRAEVFATATTAALVTGTAQEGQTLTASVGANDGDLALTYQWQRSSDNGSTWSNIAGATSSTYVAQEADENDVLRVSVTANDVDNPASSATVFSSATAKVVDAPPTVTVPVITGTAQPGQVLTASATANESDDPITYAWYSSQSNFTIQIGGGATYVVQQADQGSQIEVRATVTNDNGITASTTSAPTSTVTVPTLNVTAPIITGAPQEGQTLTASATASDPNATVTYAWYSSQSNFTIQIGTGAGYVVQEADEGHNLEVKATASKGSLTASATSVPTTPVVDAAPTVTTPSISGIPQEGQILTASASAGELDNTVTYAWYSSRTNYTIQIGSGATYMVQEAEEGYTIEVRATVINDNNVSAVSAMSAPTGTVHDAPPSVTTPIITGVAQEGQILNAFASAGQADNSVTYTWYAGGTEVGTGPSYQVQESDEDRFISVVATATNDDGLTASRTSADTARVTDAPPGFALFPTISGTQREGETLTVSATPVDGDNFVSYTWYSSADGYDFLLNIGDSYVLQESDEAHQIEVVATITNQQGVQVSATSNATGWILDQLPSVANPTLNNYSPFEGEELTASVDAVQDSDDPPLVYLWYSSASNYTVVVGGGPTYLVQEADEGHQIGVKVLALDDYNFLTEDIASSDLILTNPVADDGNDNDPSLNGTIIQSHQYFNVSHTSLTLTTHSTVVGFDNVITPDDNVLTLPEHSDGDKIVGNNEKINVNFSGTAFTGAFELRGTGDVITGSWNDIYVQSGASVTLNGTANTIDGDNVSVTVNDATVTLTGDGDTLSGQNDIVVLRGDNTVINADSLDIIIDPGMTVTLNGTNNTISAPVNDVIHARGLSNVLLINGGAGDIIDGVAVTVTATGNDFTLTFPGDIVKGSSNTIRLPDVSQVEIDAVGFNTVYGDYEVIYAPNQAGQTALVLMGSGDTIYGNNISMQMQCGSSATLNGNQDQVYGINEVLYVNNETVNLGGSNGGPLVGDTIVGSNDIINLSVPDAPTAVTTLTVQGTNNKVFGNNENITIGDGSSVELNGVFGDTITFANTNGSLVLDQSATFSAGFANSIVGFGGSAQLDLRDLVYNGNTTVSFAEDPSGTKGTLTVTDGGFPSAMVLVGDYSTTNFAVASDGHGGTLVTTHP